MRGGCGKAVAYEALVTWCRRLLLTKYFTTNLLFIGPMDRNIISIVKPTRCTNVSNLFYFRMTLYMFQMVFPSIIRSSRLYIQQPSRYCYLLASKEASSRICLTNDCCCNQADTAICLQASKQADSSIWLTNACCCMYSLELLMMDGKTVQNM